jgi:hypothetical protein
VLNKLDADIQGKLSFIASRLQELNNTASQILIFLSFAIVAGVTYLSPSLDLSRRTAVYWALRWWIGAIFPTVIGIIPLKEVRDRDLVWYRFLLRMRLLLMWGLHLHRRHRILQSSLARSAKSTARRYFFSSAGQFVSSVIEVDLARSAVSTAKCWPSGLTSYMGSEEAAFGKSN